MRSSEERKSDSQGKRGVPSCSHLRHNRLRLNAAPQSTGEEHCDQSAPDHAKIRRGTYRIPYRKHVESLLSKDLLQSLKQNALIYIYSFFFPPQIWKQTYEFIKYSNKIISRMAAHNMHWCTCGSYGFSISIFSEYCCSSVTFSLLRGSTSGQPFYWFYFLFFFFFFNDSGDDYQASHKFIFCNIH